MPSDTTPPLLIASSPADDATNAGQKVIITLTFNEPVMAGPGVIELHKANGDFLMDGPASYFASQSSYLKISGNQVTIDLDEQFSLGGSYYLLLGAGAFTDLAGNPFAGIASNSGLNFTVTSVDTLAPSLHSSGPWNGQANFLIDGDIKLYFDEPVVAGTGDVQIHKSSDGSVVVDIPITDAGRVTFSTYDPTLVTLDPEPNLDPNTDYYLTFSDGLVQDLAGNPAGGIEEPDAIEFSTGPLIPKPSNPPPGDVNVVGFGGPQAPDNKAPSLVDVTPTDNGTNVPTGSSIVLRFNEDVQAGTGSIEIRNADGSLFDTIATNDPSHVVFSGLEGVIAVNFLDFTNWVPGNTLPATLNGLPITLPAPLTQPALGETVTITPHTPFDPFHKYYIVLEPDAVQDYFGNSYAGFSAPWADNFTTATIQPIPPPAFDFDGNDRADILWQNDSGQAAVWTMDGYTQNDGAPVGANPGPTWHIAGAGVFAHNGKADMLWQNDNGLVVIWYMDGLSSDGNVVLGGNPGPSWHVKGTGDFNGDGQDDVLWQNDNGQAAVWTVDNGSQTSGSPVGGNPGPSWHVIGAGDFNGDGKADILWQNDDGQAAIWLMDGLNQIGGAPVGGNPGPSWHVKAAADFNGDGKADILWQNDDGQAAIWLMDGFNQIGGAPVGGNPGPSWHVKGAADFDGDGKADILWQNDSGQAAIWTMNGLTQLSGMTVGGNPGSSWHIIAPGG